MLKFVHVFFRAVLVAAIFFIGSAAAEQYFFDRVLFCIDGDTVVLSDRRKVRLAGIDTPEKASSRTPAQYYAREAHELTRQLVLHRNVRVVPVSGNSKDRYGRLVAELFLSDGTSVNERLLQKGAAYFYDHRDVPNSMRTRFLAAQNTAIKQRNGFWKRMLERSEARDSYIGNRNSRRFFSVSCSRRVHIARKNRLVFPNLEAAFTHGYAPVRSCSIWPDASEVSN